MSTPRRSAESAWRIVTHLWMVIKPALCARGNHDTGTDSAEAITCQRTGQADTHTLV